MHRPTYTPISKFKTQINVANTILYFNQEKKKMTQFSSLAVALVAIFSLVSSDVNCVTAKGVTVTVLISQLSQKSGYYGSCFISIQSDRATSVHPEYIRPNSNKDTRD